MQLWLIELYMSIFFNHSKSLNVYSQIISLYSKYIGVLINKIYQLYLLYTLYTYDMDN